MSIVDKRNNANLNQTIFLFYNLFYIYLKVDHLRCHVPAQIALDSLAQMLRSLDKSNELLEQFQSERFIPLTFLLKNSKEKKKDVETI